MKTISEQLRVRPDKFRLADRDPGATPGCRDKTKALERTRANLARIDAAQYLLHAEGRQSLLIVLQGMDAAGKDGLVRKVMSAFNPQGCKAWSFKVPTAEEAAHDFLWRIHRAAPGRGEVAIFNRSHYEDVLVVRVHELVPKAVWEKRYDAINEFEALLQGNGTRVLKFFLHIDREEQRERLLARLDDPEKRWKFNEADIGERSRWDDYQRAFEDVLTRCSPKQAPWYVIPSNRKWYRDLAVSEVVADALADMDPKPPEIPIDVKRLRAKLARG
jgi:PPK2 family polyphosphate:nucleotide phosphotransferase